METRKHVRTGPLIADQIQVSSQTPGGWPCYQAEVAKQQQLIGTSGSCVSKVYQRCLVVPAEQEIYQQTGSNIKADVHYCKGIKGMACACGSYERAGSTPSYK